MDNCVTCGRRDAHAKQRAGATTNLPYEHCYHAHASNTAAVTVMHCCWCGETMPTAVTVTSGNWFHAHGGFAPHGSW